MKSVRIAAAACAGLLTLVCAAPGFAAALAPKLFLSADGVALSSTPGKSVLKRSIEVDRTTGKAQAAWTASSDQSWLSVTASGATGGKLTVQADPTGLAADQEYTANVTVSTDDGFTDTETLHVGLWVGSSKPGTVQLQQTVESVATNPVLPYAYVTDGGANIKVYNVYSGAVVTTFHNVAPTLGYMDVSSDGATLFAADTTNFKIVALDAASGAVLSKYQVGYQIDSYFSMVYARPYGQPALYLSPNGNGAGGIIAYPSGDTLLSGGFGNGDTNFLAVTPDGRGVYTVTMFLSPGSLYGYSLSATSKGFSLKSLGSLFDAGSNCRDLAVSRDGKHVYPACGAPYEFGVFDGKTLTQVQTLAAAPYPANVEIDTFDNVVGGIDGVAENNEDVFVYNQKGKARGTVSTPVQGEQQAALKVSGDSTRVVNATESFNTQFLLFRNMP
jgi:hypothetical protein